jgi:protein O-GlcNAc transferase
MNGKRLLYKGFRMKKIALLTLAVLIFLSSGLFSKGVSSDIQEAFDNRRYDEAIQLIEVALKKDKRNADLYFMMGRCYLKKHNLEKAEDAFIEAISKDSKNHEARFALGQLQLEMGKLEEAKATFEEGLKKAKKDQEIAIFEDGLGLYYLALKDFSNADIQFRKAQIKDPENMDYIMHQGDASYEQGSYAIALGAYNKVVAVDSLDPEIHFRISRCKLMQKDFAGALESIDKTLELDSSYTDAYLMAGNIYTLYAATQKNNVEQTQGLLSNSIALYNKYLEMTGDSGIANYYRGKAYYALNDFENAAKDFESSQRIGLEKEDLMSMIGKSYSKLKQYDRAIEFLNNYEKSLYSGNPDYQLTINDKDWILERASAYSGLADSASRVMAAADFDKALELDSADVMAYYRAGVNLYFLKDYQKALDYLLTHVELYPEDVPVNPGAYLNIAYCYLAMKDFTNALMYLDIAIEKNPEYTQVYELKANIFMQMEKYDSAVVYYGKSKEINPDNCEPDRWIGICYLKSNPVKASPAITALKNYIECKRVKGGSLCEDVETIKFIAIAYQYKNDVNSAFEWVKKGLKCDPNNPELKKMFDELELEVEL